MTTPTGTSPRRTDTLTDRYVWAVLRNLPDSDRPEVDLELRELIGEMIDDRDRDTTPADADTDTDTDTDTESAVLAELGDPRRLAARYVSKPRVLIGAQLFPEYVRILKLVWTIAFPVVIAAALLAELLDEDPSVGGAIGAVFAGAYGSTVLVAFWVTIVYAALERSSYRSEWTLDDLPAVPVAPSATVGVAEGVFNLIITIVTATLLVWQQLWPPLDDSTGTGVPVLDPDIWNGAAQALLVLLGASFVVTAMVLARRRWSWTLAVANAVINAASLGIIAWLALDDRLVNEEFLVVLAERADFDTVPTINPWLIIAVIAVIEVWDSIDAFRKASRA